MPKVRKMLGRADDPCVLSLMGLIDTQSKATIARWCLDYARTEFLPIYQKAHPEDGRGVAALDAAERWLAGQLKLPSVKKLILETHAAARELENDPVAQAAIRAVGQAASVVHVATHALGMVFYGAAATAYGRLGLEEPPEIYDALFLEECTRAKAALASIAVPDEPNPVKLKWYC